MASLKVRGRTYNAKGRRRRWELRILASPCCSPQRFRSIGGQRGRANPSMAPSGKMWMSMQFARGLAVVLMFAALGCQPELANEVTPGEGWPDLAQPPIGERDGRADAALIIAIDDPA